MSETGVQVNVRTSIGEIHRLEIRDGKLCLVLGDRSVWDVSAVDGNGVWAVRNRGALWYLPMEAIGEEWGKIQALWEQLGVDRHHRATNSSPARSRANRDGALPKRSGRGRAGSAPASKSKQGAGGGGLRRVRG